MYYSRKYNSLQIGYNIPEKVLGRNQVKHTYHVDFDRNPICLTT